MAEFDRSIAQPRAATAEVDVGLRSYMLRVYNYMASGLGITGLAAIATYMAAVQTTDAGGSTPDSCCSPAILPG